jgi:hypothetical protein
MYGFNDLSDDGLVRVLAAYQKMIDEKHRGQVKKDGSPTKKLAGWISKIHTIQAFRAQATEREWHWDEHITDPV